MSFSSSPSSIPQSFKHTTKLGPTQVDVHTAVDRFWPDRGARIEPMSGGITNRNFKVEVAGHAFVLRMGGAQTALLGIDRQVEYEASKRAAELGLGPQVEAFITGRRGIVTR